MDADNYAQISIRVPADLKKALKLWCVENNQKIQDTIITAIMKYLDSKKK